MASQMKRTGKPGSAVGVHRPGGGGGVFQASQALTCAPVPCFTSVDSTPSSALVLSSTTGAGEGG